MLHAMIMAGGGGTRFWPRSRAKRPKQFLNFSGNRTLLQATVDRISAQIPPERTWVITGEAHREEAQKQLPELPSNNIVGEPMGRDTAACVGLGAALVHKHDPDATQIVMPADHVIEPAQEFARAVHAAEQVINDHPKALLTFGIPPTFPSTGYGYIQRGESVGSRQGVAASKVKKFVEKPSADTAEKFVTGGDHFWNSGIFVWKPSAILGELKRQKPGIHDSVSRVAEAWGTPQQASVFRGEYEKVEKISVDFAVMQGAPEVLVVHAPYKWDDVGNWLALERHNPQDTDDNTVLALHSGIDTKRCVIVSDPNHLVTTLGVQDLIIVQDGNATLIADRKSEAAVKQLVDKLKATGLERFL